MLFSAEEVCTHEKGEEKEKKENVVDCWDVCTFFFLGDEKGYCFSVAVVAYFDDTSVKFGTI